MLLAVVVMAALILIALAAAAPVMARDMRRQKELESEHRAQQYVRAIQLYQRACKCASYPGSMEALEKSTTVRFLRQRYVDPLTGKSDWRLVHNPQTKTKGFFGQELTGLSSGLGSAAGMASGNGSTIGGSGSGTTTIGSTTALASGFGGATVATPATGSSGTGTSGTSGTSGTAGTSGANGSTGSSGFGSSSSAFGSDNSGGVIYGVGPAKSGDSILTPNQQTTYETWEFWYDPRIELLKANVNILGGGGPAGSSSSGTGSGPTSTDASQFGQGLNGQSNAGTGLGSTGTTGATGTTGSTGTTGTSGSTGTTTPP